MAVVAVPPPGSNSNRNKNSRGGRQQQLGAEVAPRDLSPRSRQALQAADAADAEEGLGRRCGRRRGSVSPLCSDKATGRSGTAAFAAASCGQQGQGRPTGGGAAAPEHTSKMLPVPVVPDRTPGGPACSTQSNSAGMSSLAKAAAGAAAAAAKASAAATAAAAVVTQASATAVAAAAAAQEAAAAAQEAAAAAAQAAADLTAAVAAAAAADANE